MARFFLCPALFFVGSHQAKVNDEAPGRRLCLPLRHVPMAISLFVLFLSFRYGILVARLGDRCLVRWIPLSAFLAAVEEDLQACEAVASRRRLPYQQGSPAEAPSSYGLAATTNAYAPPNGAFTFQQASSTQASATPQSSKHHQHQQRGPVGGRTSARLAGTGGGFGGGGQTDHLADTFGAYDACVEAARVEPAVFAFAAWRQYHRRHQQHQQQYQCLSPGQWVEVMIANKEDKRFFYSAIGIIQRVRNEEAVRGHYRAHPGSLVC